MKKSLMFAVLAAATAFTFGAPTADAAPNCPTGPDYKYVSRSPQECLNLHWVCTQGVQFYDADCGCGCYTGN